MKRAQTASLRLADQTEQRVSDLFTLYSSGRISLDEFKARAAAVIATANTAAAHLADIAVATEATKATGRAIDVSGMQPTATQVSLSRIEANIDQILTFEPDVTKIVDSQDARLRQMARSEPLLTTATATQAAMKHHDATGWIRLLDADPCKVCRGWADGVVRSVGTSMARHNGCGCIQQPVF